MDLPHQNFVSLIGTCGTGSNPLCCEGIFSRINTWMEKLQGHDEYDDDDDDVNENHDYGDDDENDVPES